MKRILKITGLAAVLALCLLLTGCYQPPDEVNNGGQTSAITASFFNTLAPKVTATVTPDTVVVETPNSNIGVIGGQETPTPTAANNGGGAWDNWGSAPTSAPTPTPVGYTTVTPGPGETNGPIETVTAAPPTPTTAPVTSSPVPKSLQKGFTGSDAVRALQKRLKELGYYKGKYGIRQEDYPVAAELYANTISLPLHNKMEKEDYDYVINVLSNLR